MPPFQIPDVGIQIGVVDSRRAAQVMERLLTAVVDNQAQTVIIDVLD